MRLRILDCICRWLINSWFQECWKHFSGLPTREPATASSSLEHPQVKALHGPHSPPSRLPTQGLLFLIFFRSLAILVEQHLEEHGVDGGESHKDLLGGETKGQSMPLAVRWGNSVEPGTPEDRPEFSKSTYARFFAVIKNRQVGVCRF